jgi:hypothetical protein
MLYTPALHAINVIAIPDAWPFFATWAFGDITN